MPTVYECDAVPWQVVILHYTCTDYVKWVYMYSYKYRCKRSNRITARRHVQMACGWTKMFICIEQDCMRASKTVAHSHDASLQPYTVIIIYSYVLRYSSMRKYYHNKPHWLNCASSVLYKVQSMNCNIWIGRVLVY